MHAAQSLFSTATMGNSEVPRYGHGGARSAAFQHWLLTTIIHDLKLTTG